MNTTDNLDSFYAAKEAASDPVMFPHRFLGALSGELITQPEVWKRALHAAQISDGFEAVTSHG